jgi:hypothetical protein
MHRNVGVGELWKKWEKWSVGEGQFSIWENLQVLLSMSARRHSLGQLQSAGGAGQADKAGEI